MKNSRIYFPGFNGVRAIAASAVIFHHIEEFKDMAGLPNVITNKIIQNLGINGVNLFFVLSGFLITFLLLNEREANGSISLKDFYLRRCRRILPLYILIIIIGFVVVPMMALLITHHSPMKDAMTQSVLGLHENYWQQLLFYVFLLPQLSLWIIGPVMCSAPAWTLGYEEHFYAIWPLVCKAKKKYIPIYIAVILLTVLGFLRFLPHYFSSPIARHAHTYLSYFHLEYLLTGSLGAYFYVYYKQPLLSVVINRWVQRIAPLAIIFLLCFGGIFITSNYIIAGCYMVLLLNISTTPYRLMSLEQPWLNHIGKISYGIYMLHCFAILSTLLILEALKITSIAFWMLQMIIYVCVFGFTYLLAKSSYQYMEKPILTGFNKTS
jgi:peptidoglycan/LPS O-acetylase OafA/YrhL